MKKRPLLFGVLAFVLGEWTGLYPYMAMGLGMAGVLIFLYIVLQGETRRKREDSVFLIQSRRKKGRAVPFLMLLWLVCFWLGLLNSFRCRLPDLVYQYMEDIGQETICCMVEGRVKRIEIQEGRRIFTVRTEQLGDSEVQWNQPYTIRLYERQGSDFVGKSKECNVPIFVGNRIRCELNLKCPTAPTNPGEFNGTGYYQARGIDFLGFADVITVTDETENLILQQLTDMQEAAQDVFVQCLSQENAGIMSAMLLGASGNMDSSIRKLYQRNGIAHILAISALHISIIGKALYRLLRKLGGSFVTAGIPVMIILILYAWMTGLSGSTIRAVLMFLLMLAGDMLGRTYDMLTSAGIACLCILLENPYRLWDAGFLLSFGAVLSLGIAVPAWKEVMELPRTGRICGYVADGLCASVVLQIMTGPIIAYFYYEIPVYGVFLNVIIIPLMTILVVCGGISLLLFPILPWVSFLLLQPCEWILDFFRTLCEFTESLPGAVWHIGAVSLWEAGVYYGILILLFLLWKHRKRIQAVLVCVLIFSYLFLPVKGPLTITMLDVGQGDGILIETPNHRHILIDGGSSSRSSVGEYILTPAIKFYGTGSLDYVFVSHMDQDHVNGIQELITMSRDGGISIQCMVLPEAVSRDTEFQDLILQARTAGIQVTTMDRGDMLLLDGISLTCLYPIFRNSGIEDDFIPEGSKNNNSMVVSLSYGEFDMLFTGDLEVEGERILLEEEVLLQRSYDILKVGHHGSSTSSSEEFLERLGPDFALISCAKNNSYGHPHTETLERLEAAGSRVLSTVECGAIEIQTDGRNMEFHFYNADASGLWYNGRINANAGTQNTP